MFILKKIVIFKDHRGGPGKPNFDGPPLPVEGMTVRELEAITGNYNLSIDKCFNG